MTQNLDSAASIMDAIQGILDALQRETLALAITRDIPEEKIRRYAADTDGLLRTLEELTARLREALYTPPASVDLGGGVSLEEGA